MGDGVVMVLVLVWRVVYMTTALQTLVWLVLLPDRP